MAAADEYQDNIFISEIPHSAQLGAPYAGIRGGRKTVVDDRHLPARDAKTLQSPVSDTAADADDMDFVAEAAELSVKELIMRFPKKEKEIFEVLGNNDGMTDKKKQERMASKVKYWEVWFRWWDSVVDPDTGEKKWETIEGVAWKYKNLLLGKMKNPYWDWQGKKKLFKYSTGEKKDI